MIAGKTQVVLSILEPTYGDKVRARKVVLATHHDGGDRGFAAAWAHTMRELNPTLGSNPDVRIIRTTTEVL